MTLADAFLTDFEAEAVKSRAVLAAVPADRYDWKPHERSMSLGELAGHVAETPTWLGAMLEDELDLAASMEGYTPYVPTDAGSMLSTFDANVAAVRASFGEKDDAFLSGAWRMRSGDAVLMDQPRHSALRTIGIHHSIHHRGQLTVYLRLLGVDVPPTYGPTADAAVF